MNEKLKQLLKAVLVPAVVVALGELANNSQLVTDLVINNLPQFLMPYKPYILFAIGYLLKSPLQGKK